MKKIVLIMLLSMSFTGVVSTTAYAIRVYDYKKKPLDCGTGETTCLDDVVVTAPKPKAGS